MHLLNGIFSNDVTIRIELHLTDDAVKRDIAHVIIENRPADAISQQRRASESGRTSVGDEIVHGPGDRENRIDMERNVDTIAHLADATR